MKLTNRQKVFGGFLIIGLIALIWDRCTGSGAPAPSAEDSVAVGSPTAVNSPPAKSPAPVVHRTPLVTRLAELSKADNAASSSFRDPFSAGCRWVVEEVHVAPPAPIAPVVKIPPPPPFESVHHLTAVFVSGKHSRAVIDGNLVSIGQKVAGHTLVAVTQDMAVLEAGDSRAVLRIANVAGEAADAR